MKQLTEVDAATAYARAWNRLDPAEFIELLAFDVDYASQWVFQEMKSCKTISEYLIQKMLTVKQDAINKPTTKVYAELGTTTEGFAGRDCVLIAQGERDIVKSVVLFEVEGQKVKRFDMCIPELFGIIRSGVYPA